MQFENFFVIFFPQASIFCRKTSTCLHHRHPRMGRREPQPGWWTQPGWRRCSPRVRCAWRTRTGRGCLGSNKNRGEIVLNKHSVLCLFSRHSSSHWSIWGWGTVQEQSSILRDKIRQSAIVQDPQSIASDLKRVAFGVEAGLHSLSSAQSQSCSLCLLASKNALFPSIFLTCSVTVASRYSLFCL